MPSFPITGATGQQGGATARLLLKEGHIVNALVRDVSSPAAQSLKALGAVIFKGNFDNVPAIEAASTGCSGIFMNLYPNFISAARKAGTVTTFVVSTSFWVQDPLEVHKYGTAACDPENATWLLQPESRGRELGEGSRISKCDYFAPGVVDAQLFQCAAFFPELAKTGELCHAYTPTARMPHLAASDVGKFAAAALTRPEVFAGKEIELGSENLTIGENHGILEKVMGRKIPIVRRSEAEVAEKAVEIPAMMFFELAKLVDLSIDGSGYESEFGIKPLTFEEFLIQNKEKL